tara:strand:+ start:138 stop:470 length:333 start_codon:yes stop_codon:yes gene_type:complete
MTEDLGQDLTLFDEGIPLFLDHDLVVADTGTLYINTSLTIGDDEDKLVQKPFYEVIDFILDECENDYHEIYGIANELVREAERLRDLAQKIEDSTRNVADLFDADYDPAR